MPRPNILWIFPDELRTDALGCYGNSWARVATPNFDRIAASGVLFENGFCNSPACVPSRSSLMTATPPDLNGVYSNEGAWASFKLPQKFETIPEVFARNGYRTASIGKSHMPKAYSPWQEEIGEGGGMHIFGLDKDAGPLEPIVPQGIPSPVGGVFPDEQFYPPATVTRNAIRWLDSRDDGQPFFLRVAHLQPHTPVLPPATYRRLYDPRDWPGHDLPRDRGSVYENRFAAIVGGRELSDAEMRRAQADYHALVAWLDAQVGILLSFLQVRGLLDNTIIVVCSDHGASLGENGLLSKVVFAPQSHRVPLLVSWPGHLPEGERRTEIAELLDLGRTFCDLCGIEPAETFHGRPLFSAEPPEHVYSVIGSGHAGSRASSAANTGAWVDGKGWPRRACVRTDRFRLDMNVRQDGALIAPENEDIFLADWRSDPHELTNLAGDPDHAAIRDSLRAALLARQANAVEPDPVAFTKDEAPEFAPPTIRR
jgi:choline-sulfatase